MQGGKRPGAGRKPGFAAQEAEKTRIWLAERLKSAHEPIVKKAIAQAKQGDKNAREWLYNRAFGRARLDTFNEEDARPVILQLSGAVAAKYNVKP